MRVGLGFDAHAFDVGRPLVLGGILIEGAHGLAGHSDADVLSHAIADSILGAAGLGDLGESFPATERWKDASSLEILREVGRLLEQRGLQVVNVDATLIAQAPRLGPHRDRMRSALAEALGLDVGRVSVKFTTSDGMGFTGRNEGMAALASTLVEETPRAEAAN